jgi:putative NADH-flavin reductase
MKTVIVFGATGAAGGEIVKETLAAGHQVTAFTRKDTHSFVHERLSVAIGDPADFELVANAIANHDVIVNALGNRNYQDPVLVSHPALRSILQAIGDEQRLITVGAISMLQYDETSLRKHHQDPKISEYVYYPLIDHFANWEALQHHSCNWLMVCPPMIKPGPADDTYVTRETFWPEGAGMQITAGNVARFIAREITANNHNRTRIGIGTKATAQTHQGEPR